MEMAHSSSLAIPKYSIAARTRLTYHIKNMLRDKGFSSFTIKYNKSYPK